MKHSKYVDGLVEIEWKGGRRVVNRCVELRGVLRGHVHIQKT